VTRGICGVALIALLAIVPAGCGSDKSDSAKAPTKAEFLKKGNAICRAGSHKIDVAGKKIFTQGKPSAAKLNEFATKTLIPGVQAQVSGIKNLTPPKGDEAKVKAITDSAQQALDKGKANPALLVSDKTDPFAKTNKMATAYGLKACGAG
jgi:hypothetical protein